MRGRELLTVATICLAFAAIAFVLLTCSGCASMTPAEHREALLLVGSSAADIATTHAALRTPGVVEGNPVMRGSVGKQIAINAASDALVIYLTHRLRVEGSPHWAWPSRVIVGLHLTAAGANLRFVW